VRINFRLFLPLALAADQQSDSRPVRLISEQGAIGIARASFFFLFVVFPRLIEKPQNFLCAPEVNINDTQSPKYRFFKTSKMI
jgi:hypothetical protein